MGHALKFANPSSYIEIYHLSMEFLTVTDTFEIPNHSRIFKYVKNLLFFSYISVHIYSYTEYHLNVQ